MATTFVVENGSGLATANAYISVADADQYIEDHGNSSDWTGSDNSQKEEAIRMATQYLDAVYGGRWIGIAATSIQSLDFPRSGMYVNGYYRDSDSVPQEVKDATCEMAVRFRGLSSGELLIEDQDDPGAVKEYQVKVGSVMEKTVWLAGKSDQKSRPIVDGILHPLLTAGYIIERG
jgi:hypothetical protein